jgi:hypothetical protein
MDIVSLPGKWRREAASQQPVTSSAARLHIRLTLRRCADELELANHQDRHDSEFRDGCRFCDWEREHNDHYPDGGINE